MKRILVTLLLSVLVLSGCSSAGKLQPWGKLQVGLAKIEATDTQWTAQLVVKNPTKQVQLIQYQGPARYTLVVTQGEKEVLRTGFDSLEKPELLNLGGEVEKKHPVAWTYKDQEGNKLPAGTYQVKVELNAATPGADKAAVAGPVKVTIK